MFRAGKSKLIFCILAVVLFSMFNITSSFSEVSKEYDEFSGKTTYKSVFPYMDPWHTIAMAFIKKNNTFNNTIIQFSIQSSEWHFFAEHDLAMKIDGNIKKLDFITERSKSRGTNKLYTVAMYDLNKKIINIHPGILSQYRGRHPLPQAILNHETYMGITAHVLNKKIDSY